MGLYLRRSGKAGREVFKRVKSLLAEWFIMSRFIPRGVEGVEWFTMSKVEWFIMSEVEWFIMSGFIPSGVEGVEWLKWIEPLDTLVLKGKS